MRLYLSFAIFVGCSSVSAFQLSQGPAFAVRSASSSPTSLFANSKNIRAAMEATETFGPTSPEARLAWEVVEEFDGNDNSAAYTPDEENRMSDEQLAQAYAELQASAATIERRAEKFQYNKQHMNDVIAELQAIKLTPPERKPSPKIPGLWDAKLKAKAVSLQFGNSSPEARVAWEEVEEIASAGLDNAMGETMTETCLVEAAEACFALEELDRFINVGKE